MTYDTEQPVEIDELVACVDRELQRRLWVYDDVLEMDDQSPIEIDLTNYGTGDEWDVEDEYEHPQVSWFMRRVLWFDDEGKHIAEVDLKLDRIVEKNSRLYGVYRIKHFGRR